MKQKRKDEKKRLNQRKEEIFVINPRPVNFKTSDPIRLRNSNIVILLHVLDHVPLTHPSVGANAVTSRIRALIRRWVLLLEMDFQELLSLEGVKSSLLAAFERARVHNGIGAHRLIAININVMVVSNMLTQVILALESVVTSISRKRVSQPHEH